MVGRSQKGDWFGQPLAVGQLGRGPCEDLVIDVTGERIKGGLGDGGHQGRRYDDLVLSSYGVPDHDDERLGLFVLRGGSGGLRSRGALGSLPPPSAPRARRRSFYASSRPRGEAQGRYGSGVVGTELLGDLADQVLDPFGVARAGRRR